MTEQERYEKVDMPFYKKVISPTLPEEILDFHTHSWIAGQWISKEKQDAYNALNSASLGTFSAARYMTTELEYGMEKLLEDGRRMFPDKTYSAVCFGQPTPAVDIDKTNSYIAKYSGTKGLYPLRVTGKNKVPAEVLRQEILENGYYGYKVYLDWVGNDYGNVRVEDMIGPVEMELANELGLVVLLHVPRSGRLADTEVQRGVRKIAEHYPNASIVLAHCGRCYHPLEMKNAIESIRNLNNVYLDTSMVMDVTVLQIVFNYIHSSRVLFATDFPVAAMRGKRVNIMDHWVDVVLEGYPESDFRVGSNNMRASFMAYEIILAINIAAEMSGISVEKTKDIYYNNGIKLLKKAMSCR
ncbi:MAG TPA: amidohydrolase family protein [Clostridiaceae bacterium]|nr:amidohydrolase family protein [Clostridiaceae bacterium]